MRFKHTIAPILLAGTLVLAGWSVFGFQDYPTTGHQGFSSTDSWSVTPPDELDQSLGANSDMSPDHWGKSAAPNTTDSYLTEQTQQAWDGPIENHPWLDEVQVVKDGTVPLRDDEAAPFKRQNSRDSVLGNALQDVDRATRRDVEQLIQDNEFDMDNRREVGILESTGDRDLAPTMRVNASPDSNAEIPMPPSYARENPGAFTEPTTGYRDRFTTEGMSSSRFPSGRNEAAYQSPHKPEPKSVEEGAKSKVPADAWKGTPKGTEPPLGHTFENGGGSACGCGLPDCYGACAVLYEENQRPSFWNRMMGKFRPARGSRFGRDGQARRRPAWSDHGFVGGNAA